MKHLDLQVIEQALTWIAEGQQIWLCTVLSSFGSSPREPGSWLVANSLGDHMGSLSGGCVEEDFLDRLNEGEFQTRISRIRYGATEGISSPKVRLPCGGILDVLIEKLPTGAATVSHLRQIREALTGGTPLVRRVCLETGQWSVGDDDGLGPKTEEQHEQKAVLLRVGPVANLIIAGISPVSEACADFAQTLGFEVIICDPREELVERFPISGVTSLPILPALYIQKQGCHGATAVVALTHDPRIDDLALMEAVKTDAFYIGVMGSQRTSDTRAERLQRVGGLTADQINRIRMPIGLALGSKTPAEIALAVMADILRTKRGKSRSEL